jgi:hypothetical protein
MRCKVQMCRCKIGYTEYVRSHTVSMSTVQAYPATVALICVAECDTQPHTRAPVPLVLPTYTHVAGPQKTSEFT